MVIVAGAVIENGVPRIDERNSGKRSGACPQEKFFVKVLNAEILRTPQGEERHVRIEILRADSGTGETVPDCRQ